MRDPFVHKAGGVLSADIAVPDHNDEVRFYSQVLTTGESPLWREDLMNSLGQPIIGLGERTPEYESIPLQWMPHFQVDDIAASVEAAIELGGKELLRSPADEWAALTDPAGAGFGIIPVVSADSSDLVSGRSGQIAWLSLTVDDVPSCLAFYEKVIGWSSKPVESDDATYAMYLDEVTAAAEIGQRTGEQSEASAAWLIHLPVNDFAESLQRVRDHGGEVVSEAGDGSSAVVRDPIGVLFALRAG